MPHAVILGGGIIGFSTAYYLSTLSQSSSSVLTEGSPTSSSESPGDPLVIHIVEASPTFFASASGQAAGFLAKDWFSPAVSPLGEFSFNLHKELAEQWGGAERWGWSESVGWSLDRASDEEISASSSENEDTNAGQRAMTTNTYEGTNDVSSSGSGTRSSSDQGSDIPVSPTSQPRTDLDWLLSGSSRTTVLSDPAVPLPEVTVTEDSTEEVAGGSEYPSWLRADQSTLQPISERTTTGQVDPLRLCHFLLERCRANGVIVHHPASATQLAKANAEDPDSPTIIRLEITRPDDEERRPNGIGSAPAAFADRLAESRPIIAPPQPLDGSESDSLQGSSSGYSSGAGTSFGSETQSLPIAGPFTSGGSESRSMYRPYSPDTMARVSSPSLDGRESNTAPATRNHSTRRNRRPRTLDIPCDSLIITAGCWTTRVYETLFPHARRIPRIDSLAGHSLVLKSRRWPNPVEVARRPGPAPQTTITAVAEESRNEEIEGDSNEMTPNELTPVASPPVPGVCHAIFTSDPSGFSPEIFSRAGGDIWIGGLNSHTIPLPTLATHAHGLISRSAIRTLTEVARKLCGHSVEMVREGLCFRPITTTGKPIISRIRERDLGEGPRVNGGVFVAAGHGPWGISLSLGTGHVLSDMVLGRDPAIDIGGLSDWVAQGE